MDYPSSVKREAVSHSCFNAAALPARKRLFSVYLCSSCGRDATRTQCICVDRLWFRNAVSSGEESTNGK